MANSIHGHEVLDLMIQSGKSYTTETLIADIHAKFGTDARFFTCSSEDMTAGELVAFLEQRGKFVTKGDGFTTEKDHVCSN